jgi:8-oxo-dGTP pyrophosphatase MutT (NUDIX family)
MGSGFAPDAWVFPGGRVDEADREIIADARHAERWARRLELTDPAEAWAFVVAAVREAWEETGILLADPAGETTAERLRQARPEVLEGKRSFSDLVGGEGLTLWLDRLVYLGHWVTPPEEPRRYDTRFFLAATPPGVVEQLHGDELVDACWIRPAEAVASYEAGELRMLPPTVHTLRRLAPFATASEALEALHEAAAPTFLSRMMPHPDGVMIVVEEEE